MIVSFAFYISYGRNSFSFSIDHFFFPAAAEANLSLDSLKALYLRPLFAVYFGILNLITLTGLVFSIYASWLISNDRRRSTLYILRDLPTDTMKKLVGICMSIVGGLLASETLLLAKSGYMQLFL